MISVFQQERDAGPKLVQGWRSVTDAAPTLHQHWVSVSCLLNIMFVISWEYCDYVWGSDLATRIHVWNGLALLMPLLLPLRIPYCIYFSG